MYQAQRDTVVCFWKGNQEATKKFTCKLWNGCYCSIIYKITATVNSSEEGYLALWFFAGFQTQYKRKIMCRTVLTPLFRIQPWSCPAPFLNTLMSVGRTWAGLSAPPRWRLTATSPRNHPKGQLSPNCWASTLRLISPDVCAWLFDAERES